MSTTLNLVRHLLAQARHFQELGLDFEALRILQCLGKIDNLPAEAAEEAQQRLGTIRLERHQYKKARRHFAAALSHRPGNAEYHFCLGRATQGENHTDAKRTLDHLARAVELAPENVEYLSDFGLQALRLGKKQAGLDALRKGSGRKGVWTKPARCCARRSFATHATAASGNCGMIFNSKSCTRSKKSAARSCRSQRSPRFCLSLGPTVVRRREPYAETRPKTPRRPMRGQRFAGTNNTNRSSSFQQSPIKRQRQ